jgi:hypothetical protein
VIDFRPPPANPNISLLTNGGLEVWQRGPGAFTASAAWTADRWQLSQGVGSTFSVTRDSANADAGSQYCLAAVYTHAASNPSRLMQPLEQYALLRGRTLTLTARVRSSAINTVRLGLWDSVNGFRYSGYIQTSGIYRTLSVTAPIAAAATGVQAGIHFEASCTAYVDNVTLVEGSLPLPYTPMHPADDLARCKRYFERYGLSVGSELLGVGTTQTPTQARATVQWSVEKVVTPSVTWAGAWRVLMPNGTSQTATGFSTYGLSSKTGMLIVNVASGLTPGHAIEIGSFDATADLRIEANP